MGNQVLSAGSNLAGLYLDESGGSGCWPAGYVVDLTECDEFWCDSFGSHPDTLAGADIWACRELAGAWS